MILFFGPQGSGKGTQADLLYKKLNWPYFSVGEILRNSNDPEIHTYQQQGLLVPSEKVNELLKKTLVTHIVDNNFILDGYPRELSQAKWLIETCKDQGISIDLLIMLDVDKDESLKRLELRGRHDDTPESIETRLAIYYRDSEKILNYIKDQGIVVAHVNGAGTVEEVHERIIKELKACRLV